VGWARPDGLEAGELADALVSAAAELVGKRWRPDRGLVSPFVLAKTVGD
jgi:hypothetical protein